MVRALVPPFLLVLALAAQNPSLPEISYDLKAPLKLEESAVKDYGFGKLFDISYDSPRGGRVTAYAVVPPGAHRAGIVWQHWGQGDRSSMLPEAFNLARRGAVSVLINAPWMRPGAAQPKTDEENLASWLQDVVDLRRAADILVDHYGVAATRLGYVGHSYGATMGGLVAAGERRFRALVLMGGFDSLSDAIRHPKSGAPGDAHAAQVMSVIDADRYIGHAAPSAVFLQFARYDRFITDEQANRYAAAASEPKLVKWYECGHEFNDAQSAADRENWLAEQLGLRK